MKIRDGVLSLSVEMPGTDEPQVGLGHAIQKLREDRGMSRRALAERAGIDVEQLEAVESGASDLARWNTVAWIADAADVSLRDVGALAEQLERKEEDVQPGTPIEREK